MKRLSAIFLTVLLLAWIAAAQTGAQTQSQTNAGASSSTNVSADKSGVKAQNDTSVSASQQTNAQSGAGKGKTKSQAGADSNTDAAASSNSSIAAGTTMNAVLTKPIDSRKAKEGDEVTAKTTSTLKAEGERPIPKGTKLIGHVTKASARAKGDSESSLGIVFDRAEVAKGREVPVHAVVQALAATSTTSTMAMNEEPVNSAPDRSPSSSNGGGLVGGTVAGAGKTVDNTVAAGGNVAQQVGAAGGSAVGSASGTVRNTAGATLTSSSQGVIGLPGYALDATAATATQGSIITSAGKNVKLDSGTQMVLRVVSE